MFAGWFQTLLTQSPLNDFVDDQFYPQGNCCLQVASARLGLGVTTLKRVCRASSMKRWPFRKCNSLGCLTDRTKQVLDDGTGQDNMQKLAALQVLEKHRQVTWVSLTACVMSSDVSSQFR